MKIRDYAKSVGFDVVGKITYVYKKGLTIRCYMDDGGNRYLVDTSIGTIEIIPCKK